MVSPSLKGVVGRTSCAFFSCANPCAGSERQSASARANRRIRNPSLASRSKNERRDILDPNPVAWIARQSPRSGRRYPVDFGEEYVVGRLVDGLGVAGVQLDPVQVLWKLGVELL